MDKYSVKLMSRAIRDLDGIYDYIAHTLLEPRTALNLVGRIENAILSLETIPYCEASPCIKALLNTKKELGSI